MPQVSAARSLLEQAFTVALQATAPAVCLPPALAGLPRRPALVLGAGKAAASMAVAFHAHWGAPVRGMVVTRYGHGLQAGESAGGIEIVEAGHPSPDAASLAAGARLLELASQLRAGETLVCLISGGGSSLAAQPILKLTLEQKRAAANFLMDNGADIREINCVRKHLSRLKGGRLAAAAHPNRVATFAISDVPGDDVGAIASGPTVPDPTTQAEALRILEKYGYPKRGELAPILNDPKWETPKPGDPTFAGDSVHLVATAATALDAAARFLEQEGCRTVQLGDDLDDEAQTLGREHARLAKAIRKSGERTAILSGGETRVVLGGEGMDARGGATHGAVAEGGGRGGRNTEYLAALAVELDGAPGITALAADTDGIDGHGDHAGGIVMPEMLALGAQRGLSLPELLARHDTYRYFDACGLLLKTGPTRTNVNDFRLILCEP
ncbi:MAG TPA: glycerate kinase [Gammaproteobacteria bacterium]